MSRIQLALTMTLGSPFGNGRNGRLESSQHQPACMKILSRRSQNMLSEDGWMFITCLPSRSANLRWGTRDPPSVHADKSLVELFIADAPSAQLMPTVEASNKVTAAQLH